MALMPHNFTKNVTIEFTIFAYFSDVKVPHLLVHLCIDNVYYDYYVGLSGHKVSSVINVTTFLLIYPDLQYWV